MTIYLKNKHTLEVGDFFFKCAIGKNGLSINKVEVSPIEPEVEEQVEEFRKQFMATEQ